MAVLSSPQLPDDRGKPVDIWSPSSSDWESLGPTEGEIPRRVIQRIMSAWKDPKHSLMRAPFNRENRNFILIGGLLIFAYVVGLGVTGALSVGSPFFVGGLAGLFALMWRLLQLRWRKGRLGEAVRQTLLAEGLCASCGYRLNGIPPESDSCTVCPECHAAWKLRPDLMLAPTESDQESDATETEAYERRRIRRVLSLGVLGRPRVLATLDDAGHLVELVDPSVRKHPPAGWHALHAARQDELATRLLRYGLWRRFVFGIIAIIYCFMGVVFARNALKFTPTLSVGYAMHFLPMLFIFWGVLFILSMVARPPIKDRRKYADVMLRESLCACCLHDLSAIAPDAEERRLCPACGACWKLPDVATITSS